MRKPSTPITLTHSPEIPAWSAERDAALLDVLRAWHRFDDVRRGGDFAARSEALLELEHARRALREASRRPVLAA